MPASRFWVVCLVLASVAASLRGDGPGSAVPWLPDPPASAEPTVREESAAPPAFAVPEIEPWRPRDPVRASQTSDILFGSLTCQQTVRDHDWLTPADDPNTRRGWQADQALKLTVAGPLYVFGQASTAAEDALRQDAHVNGRTGLACQLPLPGGELLLRGGPGLSYSDPLRADRAKEHSDLLLEVEGRYPLLFGARLEFQGAASPALTPFDHDWVSQEVRLALPVGSNGTLKLGARQRWDNIGDTRQTTDSGQVFLGFELKR
jgi:hypothetical protein